MPLVPVLTNVYGGMLGWHPLDRHRPAGAVRTRINGKATVRTNRSPHQHAPAASCGKSLSRRGGFSLLDVLVSLAVILVLLGLMLPSLTHVREIARRVVCSSNERQIGLAINMFADGNDGRIPPSVFLDPARAGRTQHEMTTLYLHTRMGYPLPNDWDGLGHLAGRDYLTTPGIFYCPSHTGDRTLNRYASAWQNVGTGIIKGNYHYRGQDASGRNILSDIHPGSTALVADAMSSRSDFNHKIGANVLRADTSVFWYYDSSIASQLPGENGSMIPLEVMRRIWGRFDKGPR